MATFRAATTHTVRADLTSAHDRVWHALARPGTHLSGAERVAAMGEARAARDGCELCRRRKAALSPYAIAETHAGRGGLSADEVDVVHRVASDPGRLTRSWFDDLSVRPERYVELLSVTVHTVGIDSFHRAIGLPRRPLPGAQPGAPSRRALPAPLDRELAWVPVRRLRGVPNIAKTISLVPAELRMLLDATAVEYVGPRHLLDMSYDVGRAISRTQMELVAGRVSANNECFY